ncbi:hypothetical protein L1887_50676 [Cichorium endivia]|nr:hypothetical protein L1887_50676 [Cichorium endivia]
MSSDSKEKVDQVLYETTDHNYAAERTDSIVSHPHDGSIQFDAKGLPSDPEQYATWRRGIRKLDWRAVPPLGLLWLANFVDRSNVGNAKVAGLTTDLKLDGNKFNIALAIFYITYIASEIPSNMALRKFGAKFWLPFIVFCWGIITVFFGLVQNFAGLCVIRLLLGLWEGGLLPGWRWIFIMEGLITILFACIAWYMLPASVKKSKFLKDDERELMLAVLGRDQQNNRAAAASVAPIVKTNGDTEKHLPPVTAPNAVVAVGETAVQQAMVFEEEQFEWREIRRGLTEPQAWFTGIAYLLICNCLYSFSLFLPTILRGIYPTITTTRLQLLTVPPYVPATVLVIIIAYLADKTRMRGPFILALLPISMIGYIMLLATDNAKVSYGATFLIALGIYPTAPCILSIPINNTSGLYKRGTVNALQLMIANLAGFVATFIYQTKWAPRYVQGHSVVLASLVGAWIFMAINVWWCWSENRARDQGRREGNWAAYQKLVDEGKTRAPIGDRSPQFRYTL